MEQTQRTQQLLLVHEVGVNPTDWKLRKGLMGGAAGLYLGQPLRD